MPPWLVPRPAPATQAVSVADLEDALKAARRRDLEEEPDRIVANAERGLEKAKAAVKMAEEAVAQAKADAAELRATRAAAQAEKENK